MTATSTATSGLPHFDDLTADEQRSLILEAHFGSCTPGGNTTLADSDIRMWFQDMHPNRLQVWRAAAVARRQA